MLKIGITGNMGSGKSTVCQFFERLGISVFHADDQAKSLYNHPEIQAEMIKKFGEEVYENGSINKQKLAAIIFNNAAALHFVNNLIHPAVQRQFEKWLCKLEKSPYVLYEAAILFETGRHTYFDKIILIKAPVSLKIKRIKQRDGLNHQQIIQRLNYQWPDKSKTALADFIINNNEKHELLPQVENIHENLLLLSKQFHSTL